MPAAGFTAAYKTPWIAGDDPVHVVAGKILFRIPAIVSKRIVPAGVRPLQVIVVDEIILAVFSAVIVSTGGFPLYLFLKLQQDYCSGAIFNHNQKFLFELIA